MPGIRKTPAGTLARVVPRPRQRQVSKTFKTKREAAAFLASEHGDQRGRLRLPTRRARAVRRPRSAMDGDVERAGDHHRPGHLDHAEPRPRQVGVVAARQDRPPVGAGLDHRSRRPALSRDPCAVPPADVRRPALGGPQPAGRRQPVRRRPHPGPATRTPTTRSSTAPCSAPRSCRRYRTATGRSSRLGGGAGLRWGEAIGLCDDALDLELPRSGDPHGHRGRWPHPVQAVPEVGRRTAHGAAPGLAPRRSSASTDTWPSASGTDLRQRVGGACRRTLFRARIWRPSLVRAGLLGDVETGPAKYRGLDRHRGRAARQLFATGGRRPARRTPPGGRAALPRPTPLLRDLARRRRRTGEHGAAGAGARTLLDHARPLHPPDRRPRPASSCARRRAGRTRTRTTARRALWCPDTPGCLPGAFSAASDGMQKAWTTKAPRGASGQGPS